MDGEPIDTKIGEEASKENISQVIFNNMRRELGEDNFQNHQYVTDIFKLRAEVNPLLKSEDKTGAVAKIRESRMWKDYNDIQKELFTPEELKQLAQLDTILSTSDITKSLKKALLDFVKYRHELSWDRRPEGVRGDESRKKEKTERAVQHLKDVADFTEKMNASPIATLLALVHDIEKYTGEETLLAEHEVASAVIGGEVLQTLFQSTALLKDKNQDLSAFAGVMNKLARKVFTHGEYEFPDLNAQTLDGNIKTLFGGIYLQPMRSETIPLMEGLPKDVESSKGSLTARQILSDVSVADKHIGIKDIDKVVDEVAGPSGENLSSEPWPFFQQISNTVIENSIGAINVNPLDPNSEAYKDSRRWWETNLFILYLIKRADEIHASKEVGYQKMFENAFQLEPPPGEELTDQQKKAFFDRLEYKIDDVLSMRYDEKTDSALLPLKELYPYLFHSLYESLHSMRYSIVEGSALSRDLKKFEEELTTSWIKAHPALVGKQQDS